jgi:hypothetical protein
MSLTKVKIPAQGDYCMVSDIPAGDGNIGKAFFTVYNIQLQDALFLKFTAEIFDKTTVLFSKRELFTKKSFC